MAASRVDSEVGEYQLTSATGAVLPRSSGETRAVVKSWTNYNPRAKYIEESLSQSKFHDHPAKHSNGNGVTGNHYMQDNEKWPEQKEKSILDNKIHIASRLEDNEDTNRKMDNDASNNDQKLIKCKRNNGSFSKDKLEVTCTNFLNNEIEEARQIFDKSNQMSGTIVDNESDEPQMRAVREVKVVTAPTNNCINSPSESAYRSQDADKTIGSSKCERAGDIENRKNDCDDRMEISSPRSRAYPHGDNVVVSTATSSTGAFREALRGEASRKVVHSFAKDSRRAPGKTRRLASARSEQEESGDRETDITVPCIEDRKSSSARKCENCGESHFTYGRYSRSWKYSDYSNRETAKQDAVRFAGVNRATDLTRLTAPIATTAAALRRCQSLPRLSAHDSGVACSDHAPAPPDQMHAAPRQLVADLRQLLTLRQHYYPEGGWGWVVLLVGLLVQILSHGTHGAVGVFLQQVEVRFGSHVQAG